MKKLFFVFSVAVSLGFKAQNWTTEEQYIQRFAKYAVEEMEKYQIPASITLAQGILETGGGQSRLAREGNNHFGIKCKENWTGKTMSHTDNAPNECFRVYDNPRESYEDHSKFLKFRPFYQKLFTLDMKDYKGWAHGLKKAGYATNPKYAYILISKIEKHRLYEFDNTTSQEVLNTILKLYPNISKDKEFMAQFSPKEVKKEAKSIEKRDEKPRIAAKKIEKKQPSDKDLLNEMLVKNHPNGGKKFVVLPVDSNIDFLAKKYRIFSSQLMDWNDLSNSKLLKGDIVFLEAKNKKGSVENYTVQQGDTMHSISQKMAIKLGKLYSKNRMKEGEFVKEGQVLYLQGKKPR